MASTNANIQQAIESPIERSVPTKGIILTKSIIGMNNNPIPIKSNKKAPSLIKLVVNSFSLA